MKALIPVIVGVIAAAAGQFVSLLLASAGHGWVEPYFFSPAMWVTLPLMAFRLAQYRSGSNKLASLDRWVLLLALVLDGLLAIATIRGGGPYLPMFGTGLDRLAEVAVAAAPFFILWIVVWLSWQVAAVFLLYAPRHEGVAD